MEINGHCTIHSFSLKFLWLKIGDFYHIANGFKSKEKYRKKYVATEKMLNNYTTPKLI